MKTHGLLCILSATILSTSASTGSKPVTAEVRVDRSTSHAWVTAMLELREAKNTNEIAFHEATTSLHLHKLKLAPWFRFEFSLFGEAGKTALGSHANAAHDFRSPLERTFLQVGVIDPKAHYRKSIKDGDHQPHARFQKTAIQDGILWPNPQRFANRLEYFWRTVEVETARSVDFHLGFSEGCRVFLNGKEVFTQLVTPPRKATSNQAVAVLNLQPGTNHLLVKFTSRKAHPSNHQSYVSFNPVPQLPLKQAAMTLFSNFPLQMDWFLQDLDRTSSKPIGADLTTAAIPKNLIAFCKPERGTAFEQGLIRRALSELKEPTHLEEEWAALTSRAVPATDPAWLRLYAEACGARRLQRLAAMETQAASVLFMKRKMLRPSFYGYTEGLSSANFEKNFEPGSSLCLLELKDGATQVTELLHDEDGVFRDLDVSYDGTRILFAWKKNANIDDYHLYEMEWPSRTVRRLTSGIAVADFEGRYLPTGDLLFSSTRGIGTTDCWTTETSNLHTSDKDGRRIRRLGYDQVVTCYPSVREDGGVIYTRWDYNDRGQVFPQALFQMNPDGTGQTELYGNNSWFPTTINHARGIPGSDKILAVLHGHHTWQAGELAIIDRAKGTQETSGVQIIAPPRNPTGAKRGFSYQRDENGWVATGNDPQNIAIDRYGQTGNLHRHPYPLDQQSMLVAMTPHMNARDEGKLYNLRFHLYWMNLEGHRELLAYDPTVSSAHPIPFAPRERPHVRSSVVNHRVPTGTYFMQDIYQGPGLAGVQRGSIKKLRVVELDYRVLKIGSNTSAGRGGGAMASSPISTGNGSWDVKRILGEAQVHEDGSAMFEVPANTPVYFQAIDEDGSMAQTMRSWSTLMPNETFSCVGCHEDKNHTPPPSYTSMAMKGGAQELTPFHGPARGFSFLKEIQPILNAKCISCHDGGKNESGEVVMDLSDRPFLDAVSKRRWTQSYLNLTHSKATQPIRGNADHTSLNWVSAQSVPSMIPPYFRGSSQSSYVKKLREGHGEMTRKELDLFAAWIDLGVPYCGDYVEANAWSDQEFKHYLQMQRKRERLAAEALESREALIEQDTGEPYDLPSPPPRYQGYVEARSVDTSDLGHGYRNLALNPNGIRGESPKTSSNSVCRDLPEFSHLNVINGQTDNLGHGNRFPSWGPEMVEAPWLQIDLGQECEIDKVVITIRADFPHDSYWKSGTVTFSDGTRHPFSLKKKTKGQTISFPAKNASWIRISDLKRAEEKWCAFTEVEIWGRETIERRKPQ